MGAPKSKHRYVHATPCQFVVVITLSSAFFLLAQERLSLQPNPSPLKRLSEYAEPYIHPDNSQPKHEDTQVSSNVQSNHLSETDTTNDEAEPCLRYIFYDKPIKTGSSAITRALAPYLDNIPDEWINCAPKFECSRIAEDICTGARPPAHLIQHIKLNSSMTECLRNKGYYHVTSIRDPKERIVSAWRYAHTKQAHYFHISPNATLPEYLDRVPRCTLHTYYDGVSSNCNREEAEERSTEIASRFDEIIDLSGDAISDLHQRIKPFLADINVSPGGRSKKGEMEVPDEVVEAEYLLYNKLQKKRRSLIGNPRRVLCEI